MKNIKFLLPIVLSFIAIIICSCGGSRNAVEDFDDVTASHQRIAVLPFQTTINLRPKQKEQVTDQQVYDMEIAQGKEVQAAVESYLIRQKLRVKVQSQGVTNSKLKDNRIDIKNMLDQDPTKICQLLGVDAIVSGQIQTEQPMSNELAMGLNVAKAAASALSSTLGGVARGVDTTTNKGNCSLSIMEGQHGDRLWSYQEELSLGAGSDVQDIINTMMKRGARNFPY